jgi:alpha-D-ribose 1-methylphosphonate 5-triphosphate synthase subunit PhnH
MSLDLPGFADPVRGAQASFRAVLDAMARPGSLHPAGADLTPPAPLGAAAAAVLLTLADQDTAVFLAPAFAPARDWIVFHCGAPIVADAQAADFVLTDALPDLAALDTGSDEGPEDAATVIVQLPHLGAGRVWRLAGPGLRVPEDFAADGLPGDFARAWAANHALYPRGVDLILCAGATLAALPRSVAVTEG